MSIPREEFSQGSSTKQGLGPTWMSVAKLSDDLEQRWLSLYPAQRDTDEDNNGGVGGSRGGGNSCF